MKRKYELKLLKELTSIAENPERTSDRYGTIYLSYTIGGFIVAFLAIVFINNGALTPLYGVIGGVVSGVLIGLGIYYNSAKLQIPMIKKYCPPNLIDIKRRIDELET